MKPVPTVGRVVVGETSTLPVTVTSLILLDLRLRQTVVDEDTGRD